MYLLMYETVEKKVKDGGDPFMSGGVGAGRPGTGWESRGLSEVCALNRPLARCVGLPQLHDRHHRCSSQ